jgi:dipeptidyl aminopeptidase/acylaminoacyl peptidase
MHMLVERSVSYNPPSPDPGSCLMLKRSLVVIVFLSCTFAFAVSGPNDRSATDPKTVTAPQNPNARPIPVDDLFYSRSVADPAWSPDGKQIVFTTNLTGRYNLWTISATGGFPIQLAASDDRQASAVWSRDGKTIVFSEDRGGGEYYDLFAIPSGGGEMINLTNTPDVTENDPVFSPDGTYLALTLKARTSATPNVAVLDWRTKAIRNLSNEETSDHTWSSPVWSQDSKYLFAVRRNAADTDSDIYRISLATGNLENLTEHDADEQVLNELGSVSPDGRTVLLTSNEKGGFSNVALLDVATKKLTWVTDTQWEAGAGEFSPDGKTITYTINADGRTSIYVASVGGKGVKLDFPEGLTYPAGTPQAFSPDGTKMLILHQDSQRPSDLWVYDLKLRKARQLTYSAVASLSPQNLPASQLVHYKTFDGKIISAFLWMPFNLKRDGSHPAIVMPHGGPTGQTLDTMNKTAAALASRGYVCIAPNVRGSTGYGAAFQKANYQDLGGGDLQDEVFATKFLIDTGFVNARKIGITGGSYGGFMTLMAIGKTPDIWAAAVELFGIIDWYTMLQHSDPRLQEYEKSLLGDPVTDREAYMKTSPINYIKDAKAPLLVLQGENDIRVPKGQAEQVVDILKKQGKTVEAQYYPQEGHGFYKRENQIDSIQRTIAWFDKYLKGEPASN